MSSGDTLMIGLKHIETVFVALEREFFVARDQNLGYDLYTNKSKDETPSCN